MGGPLSRLALVTLLRSLFITGSGSVALLEGGRKWATPCLPQLLEAVTSLNQRFEHSDSLDMALYAMYDVVNVLVFIACEKEGLSVHHIPFGLTPVQTAVLMAIVKSPIILHWNQDFSERLNARGFPLLWKLRLLLLGDASCLPSSEQGEAHKEDI